MKSHARQVLAIVATDATFQTVEHGGQRFWVGKCLFCKAHLRVELDGTTIATIEHIVPRHHGGDDDLTNLALACPRCNAQKGYRHDHRDEGDPDRQALVEQLLTRRRERYRAP